MSISTMKKLTVLAFGGDADAIVRRLMKLRCVEIKSTETGSGAALTRRFDSDGQKAEAEARLRQIREALPVLTKYSHRKTKLGRSRHLVDFEAFCADGRDASAWKAVLGTQQTEEELARLDAEITRAQAKLDSLVPWLEYDAPLNVDGTDKTTLVLGSFPAKTVYEEVSADLEDAGAYCEQVMSDEREGLYVSVLCHKSSEEEVMRRLTARGFLRVVFRDIDAKPSVAYAELEAEIARLSAERLQTSERLYALADSTRKR